MQGDRSLVDSWLLGKGYADGMDERGGFEDASVPRRDRAESPKRPGCDHIMKWAKTRTPHLGVSRTENQSGEFWGMVSF